MSHRTNTPKSPTPRRTKPIHSIFLPFPRALRIAARGPHLVTVTRKAGAIFRRSYPLLTRSGIPAVILLHDVEGLPNDEVAGILGLTVAAVKSRVHRARLFLRKKLGPVFSPSG